MGKSSRAETAARAAQLRAEAARQDRQRKQVIAAVVAVVVVIIAVGIGVVIANQPKAPAPSSTAASGADAALAKLTSLPTSTLDAAAAPNPNQAPDKLQGGTAITQDGKPKVLYVGAEYCPFCAMERWALIGALSRFGTFSGLTPTTSSSTDVHPDTPTWSFQKAKFDSGVLAFDAVETQDRQGQPLQTLEGDNLALFSKYNPKGSIPWVNYGGTNATNGATVDANVLDGKTYDQIIAGIQDSNSEIGKTMNPAINMITAQLCQLTKGQPTNVCTSPGVMSASVLLKK